MTIEPGAQIAVIKLNLAGEETWRYTGRVIQVFPNSIILEASFNRADTPFHGILLANGDRFVETFYTDRWYNIFEMHSKEDHRLKGWYCNIGLPAVISEDSLSYVDLALDLLVYPDGTQLVLDEDEFAALPLSMEQREATLEALAALRQRFQRAI